MHVPGGHGTADATYEQRLAVHRRVAVRAVAEIRRCDVRVVGRMQVGGGVSKLEALLLETLARGPERLFDR